MKYSVLFLFLFVFGVSNIANAKHIVGGEIYYTKIAGSNDYKITLKVYRDCSCTSCADFDSPADLAIFNSAGTLLQSISIPTFVKSAVNLNSNPCALNTGTACVEQAIYETTVTLSPLAGGYDITYQRCCRNAAITNLAAPDTEGATFTTHVPSSDVVADNSSPRFTNLPPVFLCFTQDINFDNSATDPDGDVLVYELCMPNTGGDQTTPKPSSAQETPPPYTPVVFAPPYSSNYPIATSPAITINSSTGLIRGIPNLAGLFVFSVCVKEFRNGVLLSTTSRDYQFKVLDCSLPNAVISATTPIVNNTLANGTKVVCDGFNITFNGQFDAGSSYDWDFGVNGSTIDVASVQNPAYVFPDTGVYIIRLITTKNANGVCKDTTYDTVNIQRNFRPDITYLPTGDQCLKGNSFNYKIIGAFDAIQSVFTWDFLNSANNNTPTGFTQSNINFITDGYFQVKVDGKQGECKWSGTLPTRVWSPTVDPTPFVAPLPCTGLTQNYKVQGTSFTNVKWDFGVPNTTADVAIGTNVNYTYADTGTYNIMAIANLIITNVNPNIVCSDTAKFIVRVTNPITLTLTDSGRYCADDGSINFKTQGSNLTNAMYTWNVPQHTIPTGNIPTLQAIKFMPSGDYKTVVSATNYGCTAKDSVTFHIYPNPKIKYTATPLIGCQPLQVQFKPTIIAEGPVKYAWSIGNTQHTISNDSLPTYVYADTGFFYTNVALMTLQGCIDTAYDTLRSPIYVQASPNAAFDVDSIEKDFFYDPFIKVTDKSVSYLPITNLYYTWGDNSVPTLLKNDTHYYAHPGEYQITLHVATANGCTSNTSRYVNIDGTFKFYVPNAFTPNHDQVNDVFKPKTTGLKEYKLSVYDRWGTRLFITSNLAEGWNGGVENDYTKLCPTDMYVWHIQLRDRLSEKHTYTGTVTLLK